MSYRLKLFIVFSCVYTNTVFGAASCDSGYYAPDHILNSTFMALDNGECKTSGYSIKEIPDDFYAIFNGFISGGAVTLCDDGHLNGNTCVPYAQGSCNNNYQDLALNVGSFMALDNGECKTSGYSIKEIPDDLYAIYNGFLSGSVVTLCPNGHWVGNKCTEYEDGDCPTNYKDLAIGDKFTTLSDGACPDSYQTYTINQQCDENVTDNICAILCDGGLQYTDIGTCASLCGAGVTVLKTGNGLNFPMYSTKQITPSINIKYGDDVCYVNLVTGAGDDAINVKYDNQTYHTVK